MTADRDLQHPDITEAERTGYPKQIHCRAPDRFTVEREFIEDTSWLFTEFCTGIFGVVEDYISKYHIEYQEFQMEAYGEVYY